MKILTDKLDSLPGIGKSLAEDLVHLGYLKVPDLVGQNPEQMYERFMALEGQHVDRCVLYTFRCAVYVAEGGRGPEKMLWWKWKDA